MSSVDSKPISDDEYVLAAYRRLLPFRFAEVTRAVQITIPDLADLTGMSAAWANVIAIPGGWLDRAVDQPEFAAWVETGKRLLERRAYEHYPSAHPQRHAEDLSRLVLSWAHLMPEGAVGTARAYGRVISLCFGRVLIRGSRPRVPFPLHWRRVAEGLIVELPDGEAHLSLNDPPEISVRGPWEQRVLPSFEGVIVDGWSDITGCTSAGDASMEQDILNGLSRVERSLHARQAPLPHSLSRVVLRSSGFVHRFGEFEVADPREVTVEHLLHWEAKDLDGRARALDSTVCKTVPSLPELDLTATFGRAGLSLSDIHPAAYRLHKPRVREEREVDWSTVDAIGMLGTSALSRLGEELSTRATEADCFVAAVVAYHFGRWREAVACLEACLRQDDEADPYRLLLAFTLRHFGRRRDAESLLFGRPRT